MDALRVEGLTFAYPGAAPVLEDVSFSLPRGSMTLLCGATGSGKSTLLRLLKRELAPKGERAGRVFLSGVPAETLSERESAARVGWVCQFPEQQIVCDKVWHELAFGAENLGLPPREIRRRVAETCAFFGISDWFDRPCADLSGGEKQILNLAAATVLRPELLLLDEPTAQLDPVAAAEFLSLLSRLREERSVTVLIAEHRSDRVLSRCGGMLLLSGGRVAFDGPPREIYGARLAPELLSDMPAAVRLAAALGVPDRPLDVTEGRGMLERRFPDLRRPSAPPPPAAGEPALEFAEVSYRYARDLPDVLRDTSLTLRAGQFYCLYGGNGSGKSTLLSVAAGLRLPQSGRVRHFGKALTRRADPALYRGGIALLTQEVHSLFLCDTVRDELRGADPASLPFDFSALADRHPYDLSGGEAQMLGLARALAAKPRILLLDEPTKGMDASVRRAAGRALRAFCADGGAVLAVTHDTEFGAEYADVCGLLFQGELVCESAPAEFFAGGDCFTTPASRMSRGAAATVDALAALCRESGEAEG